MLLFTQLYNKKAQGDFMNKAYYLSIALSSFCLVTSNAATSKIPNTTKQASSGPQHVKHSKLTSPEMDMLNTMLAANPIGTMRLNMGYNAAQKTLKELPAMQDSHDAISEKMALLLAPVKEFFDIIQAFSGMIKPLVEESLMSKAKNNQKIYLLEFFNATGGATLYFEKAVTNKAELELVCKEFMTFFSDLKVSLTPEANEAYKKLVEQYKNNKANSSKN